MKPLYRNIFIIIGLIAVATMAWMVEIPQNFNWNLAVYYLPAVIAVWGVVYTLNAWAYQVIVDCVCEGQHMPFSRSFKITLSSFALTFVTPFGFAGGPYRVMEMSRFIGTPRAISSVTLYSLMRILAHFMQWLTCVVVFIIFYNDMMNPSLRVMFGIYIAVFILVAIIFNRFYSNGLLERLFMCFFVVPGLKKWSRRFHTKHIEGFRQADENVMYLKKCPRAFWTSLAGEFGSRLINVFEIWLILHAFGIPGVTYTDALLVIGFSSFVANVLYILPLQLGAREGGLAIIMRVLFGVTANVGILVGFYTRIRELFWVSLGLLVMKIGNKNLVKQIS